MATATLVVVVLACLLSLLPVASASVAGGSLFTAPTATVEGDGTLTTDHGALRASPLQAPHQVTLTAEVLEVDVEWEEGLELSPDSSVARFKPMLDSGTRTETFRNATVRLSVDPWPGEASYLPPELLAIAASHDGSLDAVLGSRGELRVAEHETVVAAGSNPSSAKQGDQETAGYWYRVEVPMVAADLVGTGGAQGTFSLFVNNLTVEIQAEDGSWESWAGYREGPGPAPGTIRYERRVVTLEIQDGALELGREPSMTLYAPTATGSIDGQLEADDAEGSLVIAEERVRLGGQSVVLEGSGDLRATAVETGTLLLEPTGRFGVQRGAEVLTPPPAPDGRLGELTDRLPLLGLAALIVTVAAGGATLLPSRKVVHPDLGPEVQRVAPFDQAIYEGRALEADNRFEEALEAYQTATQIGPERMFGWFAVARVHIELGDHRAALEALDESLERFGKETTDHLEFRIACHLALDEEETAVRLLARLAELDLELAQWFVADLELDDLVKRTGLPRELLPHERGVGLGGEEGIDGYA